MTPGIFSEGDRVMLLDRKQRSYMITLVAGSEFHSHAGRLEHDVLIGSPEGSIVSSSHGATYRAFRPTFSDFVLKMPRGAQVIYPKDLGPLLIICDVYPGARILESGVGSGALSTTLLRAGAEVIGYEIREDFASRAKKNVVEFLGEEILDRYTVEIRDCYEGISESNLDCVVLDLPEPWNVVEHARKALRPGGIIAAYTPSITQAMKFREAIGDGFDLAETVEFMRRTWHVDGLAVRPDHRMVAHTAFLSHGRRLAE